MAASQTKTKRKTTSSKKSTGSKKQPASNGFQTEIILLVVLAASIILLVSAFGLGGIVGNAISAFLFGTFGLLAYVFPFALFIGAAFLLSNRTSRLACKKILASLVFFIFLCGFIQLITEGYVKSTTLMDYFAISSDYHTGGGIVGGAICISTTSAFGLVGGYVIIILVLMVSLILITQKSFFEFIYRIFDWIAAFVKERQEEYQEGQPERDLKKELRNQQKRQLKEERRAQRIRELEEAIAAEDALEAEAKEASREKKSAEKKEKTRKSRKQESSKKRQKEQVEPQKTGFLEGTKITTTTPAPAFSRNDAAYEQPEGYVPEGYAPEDYVPEGFSDNMEELQIQRAQPLTPQEEPEEPYNPQESYMEQQSVMEQDFYKEQSPAMNQEAVPQPEQAAQESAPQSTRQPARNPKSSKEEIASGIVNIQHEITQQEAAVKREYHYPPLRLLKKGSGKSQGESDATLRKTAQKLQDTLHNFGVNVTVTNVSCGPTVTRYELQPEMGVKVSRIVSLADDIKLNLATPDIRIEAPIPGKAAVGIEVPNKENSAVMLRDLLQSEEFQQAKSKLAFAAGKDIAGKPVVADIAKMPHLLIAGATGSGKSVCINTLIISILYKASPDEVKLIMIDPKVVELSVYNGIPHLFIPVVTDPKKAAGALNWAVTEMTNRYNTFAEYGVRNLGEYNKKVENMRVPEGETAPEKMPQIVIIVDELADLMMVAPGEVEDAICRLAQLARAAGIHLIIATQRPSVNVITGLIKANMPSRIAFSVSSGVDSRTILDMNGAEKLLGKGDMLFYPQGYQKPARLQGAFVSDEEVSAIVEFLADKNPGVEYNSQIEQQVNTAGMGGGIMGGGDERDVYFEEAGKFIIEKEKASIGMLQRMFKIGFNRAARIMDQLSDAGVVGPEEGTKPRKVLMTLEEFQNYLEG
jgi:S-DNA-T family DNA segregation ATPase FtsK/SpoIIIE